MNLDEAQTENLETATKDGTDVETTPVVETSEDKPEQVEFNPAEILKEFESVKASLSALQEEKRVFQSEKDKAIAEAKVTKKQLAEMQRKYKAAETTLEGLRSQYADDEMFAGAFEVNELRGKVKASELDGEEERKATQAIKAQQEAILEIAESVTDLGVDPRDPRLNEAVIKAGIRQGDIRGLRKVILKEASKISNEGNKKVTTDPKIEALEAKIANLQKALGKGSDSFSAPGGGGSSSDEQFLEDYSSGKSSDHARAKKLLGI